MIDTLITESAVSSFAADIDLLFYAMLATCTVVAVAVSTLLIVFSVRYRKGRQIDRLLRKPEPRWLEYLWIGLPALVFFGFFLWGAKLFLQFKQPPSDPLAIKGVAKQWMWKFYHPGGRREINELHLPVGRVIRVTLVSEDVIHSFFVPEFRVKQDVLPGRYSDLAFTVDKVGDYHLFCAEYCGTQHSQMRGKVSVLTEDNYARWLQDDEEISLADAGERLFREQRCGDCHGDSSTVGAPALQGIAGRWTSLRDGRSVRADSAYLRTAIVLPEKHIVAGYEATMPSYDKQLSEEELFMLVSYLQSLGEASQVSQSAQPAQSSTVAEGTPQQ